MQELYLCTAGTGAEMYVLHCMSSNRPDERAKWTERWGCPTVDTVDMQLEWHEFTDIKTDFTIKKQSKMREGKFFFHTSGFTHSGCPAPSVTDWAAAGIQIPFGPLQRCWVPHPNTINNEKHQGTTHSILGRTAVYWCVWAQTWGFWAVRSGFGGAAHKTNNVFVSERSAV